MRTLSKGELIVLALGVVVIIGAIFYLTSPGSGQIASTTASSTAAGTVSDTSSQPLQTQSDSNSMTASSSKNVAAVGDTVTVDYTGKLLDGTIFDSTDKHGQPFTFQLGVGQVIKGWDTGIVGMKVGETKHLVISPSDAYGPDGIKDPSTGTYVIPPNATLTFDVTLLSVK